MVHISNPSMGGRARKIRSSKTTSATTLGLGSTWGSRDLASKHHHHYQQQKEDKREPYQALFQL